MPVQTQRRQVRASTGGKRPVYVESNRTEKLGTDRTTKTGQTRTVNQ